MSKETVVLILVAAFLTWAWVAKHEKPSVEARIQSLEAQVQSLTSKP
jgi:hypothetical protein